MRTETFPATIRLITMLLPSPRRRLACLSLACLSLLALYGCSAFRAASCPADQLAACDGRTSSQGPSPRAGAAMAFDPVTSQVVLFGGGAFTSFDDTWAWEGTRWSLQHPKHHPSAREHAAIAFDAASRQLLLFGGDHDDGMGSPRLLSDTWAWTGSDWIFLPTTNTPPAAVTPHMAYD